MKNRNNIFSLLPAFLVLSLLLIGCAGSTTPSKFYILNPLSSAEVKQPSAAENNISVLIGPLEIPDYLDRSQIVTRSGNNEMKLADYDRWAGSLRENISTVLAENLSLLLSSDRVYVLPSVPSAAAYYRVRIDILRFDSIPGDRVKLKAFWTISDGGSGKDISTRASDITEKLNGPGYETVVEGMSRAVEKMSAEIAGEIRRIRN